MSSELGSSEPGSSRASLATDQGPTNSNMYTTKQKLYAAVKLSYTCTSCITRYPLGAVLVTITHSIDLQFRCPSCNRTIATPRLSDQHRSRTEDRESSTYEGSSESNSNSDSDSNFENRRLYPCKRGECNIAFQSHWMLAYHIIRKHQTRRPRLYIYKCPHCPKLCSTQNELKQHKLRHSKDYQCPVCPKICKGYQDYSQHMRGHDLGPNACHICGHTFDTDVDLYVHQLCHRDENTSHKCYLCGFTCFVKDCIERHLSTHNSDIVVRCSTHGCGRSFASYTELYEHLQQNRPCNV